MTNSEEQRWTALFAAHADASRVTAESLSNALRDFPLKPVRDVQWLARAIQPAVYLAAQQPRPAKSAVEVRNELQMLADRARELCVDMFGICNDTEDALWRFARSLPAATDATANAEMAAYEESWERLGGIVAFLEQAADHASEQATAQMSTEGPSKQWRRAADKDWRKWFAVWLSPAFEEGFGRVVAVRNPNRADSSNGPWAEFYKKVGPLAFPESKEPWATNLVKVLKSAGRVTRPGSTAAGVVRFPAGMFPE